MKRGRLPQGEPVLPVEGPKLLQEALMGKWRPVLVACTPRGVEAGNVHLHDPAFAGAEVLLLASQVFEKLPDTATPQEPFVLVKPPERVWLSEPTGGEAGGPRGAEKRRKPDSSDRSNQNNFSASSRNSAGRVVFPPGLSRLAVADGVQDPGNLGTILRSALAFAFDTVATTPGSAGVASAKVLRASAGALFRCRVFSAVPVSDLILSLLHEGFLIVVLDPRATVSIEDVEWREPLAIVCGGEAQGPSEIWGEAGARTKEFAAILNDPSDRGKILRARIPMVPGCESLNTATAAALVFHAAARSLLLF